ncbi:hypothetical protein F8M49_21125 [Rhodococcus zopfii]|uniref:Uncharacterized protein n=1 Tax=Rhodococcus zopfii TaxID=43772 RepID=A0ABU3WTA4_9NOCA|nr:hypothetical protein [Rhodococcus zopfii]MDV2477224.1 hypothetical protein [Rhodococcus zopfii]
MAAPPGASGLHRLTVTRTTSTAAMQFGTAADAVRRRCDLLRQVGVIATVAETPGGYVLRYTDEEGACVALKFEGA